MRRLNLAVVGVGYMGALHARTVFECDSANLVAIIDVNEKQGRAVAAQYGTSYYSDIDSLIYNDKVDAFVIALPDVLHVDVASRILEAGKPVLLEKPMAHSLSGAKTIAAAAQKGNARLMVGHFLRHDPRYANAAMSVKNGLVGDPLHISTRRYVARDRGIRLVGSSSVCFYLGVHDVDIMQWILGKKIEKVYAKALSKLMPSLGIQSEDAIFSTLEFEDGTIGTQEMGWTLPDHVPGINARLDLVGTEGVVQLDIMKQGLNIVTPAGAKIPDILLWPVVHDRIAGDLAAQLLHFVISIREEKQFLISVNEALQAVAVNDAILKSVKEGVQVNVEKI